MPSNNEYRGSVDTMDPNKIIERWVPQYRKGLLEFIILLRLKQGTTYGYELALQIKEVTSIDVAEGTLYPLLNRLKRDGLVVSEWQTQEVGSPRKYYKLTPIGQETLVIMKSVWSETHNSILKLVMQA
ncbi:PadR family transcriptional regulator [Alteromonas sp. A079]|uniref:PadR family transcriptional regulator n=1 Tax=Alteromonas sp. A079 TaxID=3410268 RepID=UPI003BA30CAD